MNGSTRKCIKHQVEVVSMCRPFSALMSHFLPLKRGRNEKSTMGSQHKMQLAIMYWQFVTNSGPGVDRILSVQRRCQYHFRLGSEIEISSPIWWYGMPVSYLVTVRVAVGFFDYQSKEFIQTLQLLIITPSTDSSTACPSTVSS